MKSALLDFQQEASDAFFDITSKLLTDPTEGVSPRAMLIGPCGSGKTVMLSATIESLLSPDHIKTLAGQGWTGCVVIVLTPGKGNLAEQTHDKLAHELQGTGIQIRSAKDLTVFSATPKSRTVITSNYESLIQTDKKTGDRKNKSTRAGEESNLFDFIRALHAAGIRVIVVTDEAHYGNHGDSPQISRLITDINRAAGGTLVTLEVTATPLVTLDESCTVKVDTDRVIKSGLIRPRVIVNHERKLSKKDRSAARSKLRKIHASMDCVNGELLDLMYTDYLAVCEEINSGADKDTRYNPLMLVTVNNGTRGVDEMALVKRYFASHGITEESGELEVHTHDSSLSYERQKALTRMDSKVKVLIVKVSVALGWDCPRAQFLTMCRSVSSSATVFVDQLLGRVGRMPYAKHRPDEQILSRYGYVYTESDTPMSDREGVAVPYEGSHEANSAQMELWDQSGTVRSVQSRVKRGGVSTNNPKDTLGRGYYTAAMESGAVTRLPIRYNGASTREGVATPQQDLEKDTPLKSVKVADAFVEAMKWDVQMELQSHMAKAGVNVKGKHAEFAVEPFLNFIQGSKYAKDHPAYPALRTKVLCAVLHDLETRPESGSVAKMMAQVAVVAKKWEDSSSRNEYPRSYLPYSPLKRRYFAKAPSPRKLDKVVTDLHLYGPDVRHSNDSEVERTFEKTVITLLANMGVLLSWFRNGEDVDSYGSVFTMGFPTDDPDLLLNHTEQTKLDYMLLLRDKNGVPVAFAVETKGYCPIRKGATDRGAGESVHDKALIMEQQTASNDKYGKRGHGEEKGNHIAALVYMHPSGTWYVQSSNRRRKDVPLLTWLSKYVDIAV